MSNNILFSVIVPVYNVENDIARCLDSILNQTYSNFEVICLDDGSEDGSLSIIKSYEKKDARVRCYSHENHGVSYTRNRGIHLALGRYIWPIDSDDWIEKNSLEILAKEIEKNKSDIVVFGGEVYLSDGWNEEDIGLDYAFMYFQKNMTINNICYKNNSIVALLYENGSYPLSCNKIYKRELIEANNIKYEESLALGEDEAFLFHIFPLAKIISYISDKLYHYQRNRPNSATDQIVRQYEKRACQNLKIAQTVAGYWKSMGLFPRYNYDYLKRYSFLLYDSAMLIRNNEELYKIYLKKANEFLSDNFVEYLECALNSININLVFGQREYRMGKKIYYIPSCIHFLLDHYKCFGAKKTLKEVKIRTKHKLIMCLKQNSFAKNSTFCKMIYSYYKYIIKGYSTYKKIKKKVGKDTALLACAALGTGDIYQVSLFLNEWLHKNKIKEYCLLVVGGNEIKVAESLFPKLYKDHILQIDMAAHERLRKLRTFLGKENIDFYYFCHFDNMADYLQITWAIQGLHGWNMLNFYKYKGMDLPESTKISPPDLGTVEADVAALFQKYCLKENKTVLLAPYATCMGRFPEEFWEKIVKQLKNKGYEVCSNCAKGELPLSETKGIFIPYGLIIPFLNVAGVYIGIRSGLSDIISSSTCKKIVFYNDNSVFWPEGVGKEYLSLNDMGLTSDALELLVTPQNRDAIIDKLYGYL